MPRLRTGARHQRRRRAELAPQGTLVVAVPASFIDTDMAAGMIGEKISPESVAQQVADAVEAGQIEVLADERSRGRADM